MKQILLASIFLICASLFGCKNSATTHRIHFVDRNGMSSHEITAQPLRLIVEIDEAGRLRLNKIETGTTRDMSLLAEKLEVIFADREKSGIGEREVLVDAMIDPETESFDELLQTLAEVKASPITVIRNDR